MAINVKFLKGTSEDYNSITKDPNTFYYIPDDSQLYLGTIKLSNASDLQIAMEKIADNKLDIDAIRAQLNQLVGSETSSISAMIEAAVTPIRGSIGTLENLETDNTGNIVDAINDLVSKNAQVKEASKVIIDVENENLNHGLAAKYTIMQDKRTIGIIDIPSDMFISSGKVVQNPQGQQAGTYIELTLANATHDKIYINVGSLVDIYTAESNNQIEMVVNSDTRKISATIANEGVTNIKLAPRAVTTGKIEDLSVTKGKLATGVQNSLDKADSAVQTIMTGTTRGTIYVDDRDVPVAGLGTAAYRNEEDITSAAKEVENKLNKYISDNNTQVNTNTAAIAAINDSERGILQQAKEYADRQDADNKTSTLLEAAEYARGLGTKYATAAQGLRADSALQEADVFEGTDNGTIVVKEKVVQIPGLKSAAYVDITAFDAAGSALAAQTTAISRAEEYVDKALTWGTIRLK